MIKLGEEQEQGLQAMINFLDSDELAFSLVGFAGTGKTATMQHLIEYLDDFSPNYVLCAPTHKAKLVLERATQREGITLHKLLALSPNVDIINLDFRDLRFSMNRDAEHFPRGGVVICDESSMVGDDLFDVFMKRAKECNSKVIFSGDSKQIAPVNGSGLSRVFSIKNSFTLSKIYRQSEESGLSTVLPTLREKIIPHFKEALGSEGSLVCHNNPRDFFIEAIPHFKKAVENKDILEAKFFSYTNKRVEALNSKIKEALFGLENEYNKGEFLASYENLTFDDVEYCNSMEYVINKEPIKTDIHIPGFVKLPGYRLNLFDASNKSSNDILILSREIEEDYMSSLAAYIDGIRVRAINAKKRKDYWNAKKMWKEYYKIMGSFTSPKDLMFDNRLIRKKSFDLGFATTFHKSQGSSINNTFLDMSSVFICRNNEEIRQLQYVAMSRAKKNAYVLQK